MIGEEINENDYEPCQEELYEYAQYLGMDLQKDQKYLYIAKKGLTAPLPPEWRACKNAEDEIFYKNSKTGEKTWSHPLDDFYKKMFQEAKANIQYYFQQIQDSQSDLIQRQKPLPGKALPKIMAVSAITKKTQLKSLSLENKTNIQESLNKTSVAINDISNNQEKPKKKKVKCPKMYVSEEEIIFMELKKTYSIKINEKMQQFKEQKSKFQQNQSNKSQFNNNSIIYDGLKKIYKEKFEKLKNKLINNEDAELHKQIQTLQGQYKIQQNQKDQSNIKSEKFQKQQQQLNEMRQQLNLEFQLKLDQYQKQIQKIQDQKLNDHLQKLDQEFEYEQRQLLQYTNCQRKIDMRQIQQLKININKQNNDKNLMRQLEIFHQDQIQSTDQQLEKEFKTRSNDKLNQVKIKQKSEILNHQSQLNQDIQQNQKLIHSKFEYQYKQYELSQMKSLSYQNDSYILNLKVVKKSMELLQLQQKNQLLMEKLQIYGSNQKQQNKSEFSSASKNDIDKIIFEINSIKKLVQSQSSKSFYYDDEKIQKTHDYSIDQDSKSQIQKQIYEQRKQIEKLKFRLMNDKSRVIQAQNILKQDLNYFKSEQQNELNYYKNSRLQQNQVQKIRQDLNARIIRLNQDVKNMRKNEEQIRNKDESLKLLEFDYQYQYNQRNLEQRLEDFQNEIIYYRTPFRDLDTSNDLSFLEPPNQQFKTSFQKQGENDLIDFSNLNLDDSDNQGLTKNFSFQQSNEDSTEINTNIHEQFKQKLLHNKQQRVQAKSILDGHSFWLKNLKDQINKNIYNVQTTKKSYHQHNRSMF